ncbi:hypothetical protein LguiA_028104 [Lonicera macranthoides]
MFDSLGQRILSSGPDENWVVYAFAFLTWIFGPNDQRMVCVTHRQGSLILIGDTASSGDWNRSSGSRSSSTGDKPWLKQLRELAKASFSKGERALRNDPSSSRTRLGGFWNAKEEREYISNFVSGFKIETESCIKIWKPFLHQNEIYNS